MISTCIKNYFKSLGFYFVPLGILAFFTVLTLASIIPSSIALVKATFQQIASTVSGVTFNWEEISGVIMNKVMELSKEDPAALMGILTNPDQLVALLKEVTIDAFGIQSVTDEIVALLQDCVSQLMGYVVLLFAMMIVGFFFGFVVLNLLIRTFLSQTNIFKAFVMSLIDGVIAVLCLLLVNKVLNAQTWVVILVIFALLIVSLILSLLESYLFFGIKKVPFKKVFNIKNTITLLIGDIIILGLGIGSVALCFLAKDLFIALFIAVPFVLLTVSVLQVNAATYTSTLAKEGRILKRAERKALKEAEKARVVEAK